MSEEEIIYILKQRIERKTVSSDPYYITQKAIEGILDLYNKEKEKNKDLQIKVRYYEDIMIKQNTEREFETLYKDLYRIVKTEYISKDKIRELLHSYSIDDKRFMKYLKELLGE